ncbi:MAG: hypothetical protein ACR2MA_08920 [Egibacteraceae bacterium]
MQPSDVGRRVSVRTRLPANEAARYTDTVGVLRSWADGRLRIERTDGTVTELHEADLVAGKVVPPPPRPRRRRL